MAEEKQAKTYHFHPEWEEDYFVYSHSKPVCLICNATVVLAEKGNLEWHFKTVHRSYERDFPAKTPLRATKNAAFESTACGTAVNLHQTKDPG